MGLNIIVYYYGPINISQICNGSWSLIQFKIYFEISTTEMSEDLYKSRAK